MRRIFIFWLPLAATWLMMACEGPFIAAIIARLSDPKYNLAAYGIAFSFALIVEAPIIMLMSGTIAVVKNRTSFIRMRRFTLALNILITALMIVLLLPGPFRYLVRDIMDLPEELLELTYTATLLFLPWPAAIGFRRFYQGILVADGKTRRVAAGTFIRLISMSGSAVLMFLSFDMPGAYVGSASLSIAVTVEAIAARLMVRKSFRSILSGTWPSSSESEEKAPGYWSIAAFYTPLALSSIIALGINPMVSFFMGHSRMPIESLAVLPVINSLGFLFVGLGLSFQEVALSLLGRKNEEYRKLRDFTFVLSLVLTLGLSGIAFTPLSGFWFREVAGLQPALAAFAVLPLKITVLLPGLMVIMSFQRALLMNVKKAQHITWATVVEAGGILLTLYGLIHGLDSVGAIAASISFLIGRSAANLYLMPPFLKSRPSRDSRSIRIVEFATP